MKTKLLFLLVTMLVMTACDQDDEDQYPVLVLNSNSALTASLSWSKVPSAQGYKIWQAFNDLSTGASQLPTIIATVDASTLSFEDKNLPIASSMEYYVTATIGAVEMKSNVVSAHGRQVLSLLPGQMALIPERHRAVVRTANEIVVIDYQEGTLFRRLSFPGTLGAFALAKRGGSWELYVPCADGNVYICDAADPVILETLPIGSPVTSVAVNSKGWIAVSSFDSQEPLKIFRRELLTQIGKIADFQNWDARIFFQSNYSLFATSTNISPTVMSIYTLNEQAVMISKINDPYNDWQYNLVGEVVSISDRYMVTSHSGLVFSLPDFTYQTTLFTGGDNQMDFQFSADGNTIYSAMGIERNILRSVITNGQVASTGRIPTVGYPWLICRHADEMVVLSSPRPITPFERVGQVIVETVSLK